MSNGASCSRPFKGSYSKVKACNRKRKCRLLNRILRPLRVIYLFIFCILKGFDMMQRHSSPGLKLGKLKALHLSVKYPWHWMFYIFYLLDFLLKTGTREFLCLQWTKYQPYLKYFGSWKNGFKQTWNRRFEVEFHRVVSSFLLKRPPLIIFW